eukprot:TRINITY_DN48218_c0_g1_i1.p1 TRINITY_DN48218_c0_g1~~TRINITY_DN48218_c0_g1_i1.p1  ORF type:complete len:791 (-),score=88.81 TRINITY_DN48218_c0_g1_i1:189-2561(-)
MAALPPFSSLPEGQWVVVRDQVSVPTQPRGDWRAFGHLGGGKKQWKDGMHSPAQQVSNLLERFKIWAECPHCSMRGTFEDHVAGEWHYKKLWQAGKIPADGIPIESVVDNFWQCWDLPGGSLRFNHLNGMVQMWKGIGATNVGPVATASAGCGVTVPPTTPATTTGASHPSIDQGPPPFSPELFQAAVGNWVRVCNPIGCCMTENGDYLQLPWFQSKRSYKDAMTAPVSNIMKILTKVGVWPLCKICGDRAHGFEEHVPAEKHYRMLCERLPVGKPVTAVARDFYDEWQVPHGTIRFNYIHGAIDYWFGDTPPPHNAQVVPLTQLHTVQAAMETGEKRMCDMKVGRRPSPAVDICEAGASSAATNVAPPIPLALQARPAVFASTELCASGRNGALPPVESMPQSGQWFVLCPRTSLPHRREGDWRQTPHLSSRTVFKEQMTPPAVKFCGLLDRYKIYPECSICGRSRGFEEHLGADKHYRELSANYMPDGAPIDVVREDLWLQFLLPVGAARINLLDGEIQVCKGELPLPEDVRPPLTAHVTEPKLEVELGKAQLQTPSAPLARREFEAMATFLWMTVVPGIAEKLLAALEAVGVPLSAVTCRLCQGSDMIGGVEAHLASTEHISNLAKTFETLNVSNQMKHVSGETGPRVQIFEGAGGEAWLNHLTGECGSKCNGLRRNLEEQPEMEPKPTGGSPQKSLSHGYNSPAQEAIVHSPVQVRDGDWERLIEGEGKSDGAWWRNVVTEESFCEASSETWKSYKYAERVFWWNEETNNYFEVRGNRGVDRGQWQ